MLKYELKNCWEKVLVYEVVTSSCLKYIDNAFIDATEFAFITGVVWTIVSAAIYIEYAWLDLTYVVLSPRSMSSTIVLNVPFGPKPVFINTESTFGKGKPAAVLVSVVAGFGDIYWASLLLLYIYMFLFFIATTLLTSQVSPDM